MEIPQIKNAKQILDIILPIAPEKFIPNEYGDLQDPSNGKSCFLGHIHRALSGDTNDFQGDFDGYGARKLTKKFLEEKHSLKGISGAEVNNSPTWNGYTEPEIKDRVLHMLNDMVEAGY